MPRNTIFIFLYLSFYLSGCIPRYEVALPASGTFSTMPPRFPCKSLSVSEEGLLCEIDDSLWESRLFLTFPYLYINMAELDSICAFPVSTVSEHMDFLRIHSKDSVSFFELKDIRVTLSMQPVTPSYLMPYLSDIWESWDGNRVPYVVQWELSYFLLVGKEWEEHRYIGKISPADIPDLPSHLAADVDYNGTPSAFWNYQMEFSQ